jgi:hypothetical protein
MKSIIDLWRGILSHPLKMGGYAFTAFSVIFTIVKAITHFIPGIKIEGPIALSFITFISVCFGLKKVWKPSKIEVQITHSNTIIEVLFGDLFEQNGIRAIAVNEFFDSKLGKPVSDKSLHGIFLQKCFGGHPESFDKQVDEELKGIESIEIAKVEGKAKCFPIGSNALINVNQDRYIVFAFAKTNPETCKAYSDVTMMWVALHELWQRARIESGGHEINVPLVGSGLSGLGLPTRDLLNLIILSAITETKSKEVTQIIRIVLHRDRFEDLDLRDVKKHWEEK